MDVSFSSVPEWIKSFPANFTLLGSLVAFLAAAYANYLRLRTLRAKQDRAKELVEQVRKEMGEQLRNDYEEKWATLEKQWLTLDKELVRSDPEWAGLLSQLISTSTAQAPAGIAEGYAAIEELRNQIAVIEQKIQTQRNEIIEVTKIDPVLEATIKASIENLTKRIEFLEKTRLEKWDVALIVLQMLGGLGVIFAIIFGIIKYLHP